MSRSITLAWLVVALAALWLWPGCSSSGDASDGGCPDGGAVLADGGLCFAGTTGGASASTGNSGSTGSGSTSASGSTTGSGSTSSTGGSSGSTGSNARCNLSAADEVVYAGTTYNDQDAPSSEQYNTCDPDAFAVIGAGLHVIGRWGWTDDASNPGSGQWAFDVDINLGNSPAVGTFAVGSSNPPTIAFLPANGGCQAQSGSVTVTSVGTHTGDAVVGTYSGQGVIDVTGSGGCPTEISGSFSVHVAP